MSLRLRALAAILFACVQLRASHAAACGVSGPDGVWSCSLEEHDEELRPRWLLGVDGSYTSTSLHFGHGLSGDQQRSALMATAGYAPTRRITLLASAGATLVGALHMADGRHDFDAGPSAAVGASWRAIEGRPFLVLSSQLSFSAASTHLASAPSEHVDYRALDLRLGAVFGTTVFDVLSPYLVARVFGGPVFWRYQGASVTGTDASHFQVGLGLALLLAERIDLFVEGIPLGERAISGGVAVAL